jgi:hypothetical protein
VALGEGGRTAMLLASERHRGFWELANLTTRPASQVGALTRFASKPVDVQLDVIDALPCASETFLAQLDAVALATARTVRAACDVRVIADGAPCNLGKSLARAALRARAVGPGAADLCEAVLVRRVAARCRDAEWVETQSGSRRRRHGPRESPRPSRAPWPRASFLCPCPRPIPLGSTIRGTPPSPRRGGLSPCGSSSRRPR